MSTVTMGQDVYYDPYDTALCEDPYPTFKRLRDEAPLYYNEQFDFWAVSRYADVEAALIDHQRFRSGRGVILEMIKQDIEMPPGTLIHDEGRVHTIHRALLSRVFTPRSMTQIEPQVREICANKLDELKERKEFDWVVDFAEYIPMEVFGMLLGIPQEDREAVRQHAEDGMYAEPGKPKVYDDDQLLGKFYSDYVDYRYTNPGDDVTSRLLFTEFEDIDGVRRTLTKDEALVYLGRGRRRRQPHHEPAHQLERQGARRQPRPAP